MTRMAWHPRYHDDALDGMRALTLQERGAYNTILDLIYQRGGPVPDDDRFLAGHMGCSMRLWRSIRERLIAAGKISVNTTDKGVYLTNERAEQELGSQDFRRVSRSERSAKGQRKVSETPSDDKEINGLFSHKTRQDKTDSLPSNEGRPGTDVNTAEADPNKVAWDLGVNILTSRAKMKEGQARGFIGKLLRDHKITANDLLPSISNAMANGTQDPVAYLTKAAKGVGERKNPDVDPPGTKRLPNGHLFNPSAPW